jgi:hypothetical protein
VSRAHQTSISLARRRNAKRSRTKHPKPTHGARDRPKQPQPRAGKDRATMIYLQRETEEKARQPKTKLSAIAQTCHIARVRDAKRSRTTSPKPTHGARDRPKQQDRATIIDIYREGRETRPTAWAPKGEEAEAKPSAKHIRGEATHKQTRATRDTPTQDKLQTHPHMSA